MLVSKRSIRPETTRKSKSKLPLCSHNSILRNDSLTDSTLARFSQALPTPLSCVSSLNFHSSSSFWEPFADFQVTRSDLQKIILFSPSTNPFEINQKLIEASKLCLFLALKKSFNHSQVLASIPSQAVQDHLFSPQNITLLTSLKSFLTFDTSSPLIVPSLNELVFLAWCISLTFCSKRRLRSHAHIKLLFAAAGLLAIKCLEEENDDCEISINNYLSCTKISFSKLQIIAMEKRIAQAVNWNFDQPSIPTISLLFFDNLESHLNSISLQPFKFLAIQLISLLHDSAFFFDLIRSSFPFFPSISQISLALVFELLAAIFKLTSSRLQIQSLLINSINQSIKNLLWSSEIEMSLFFSQACLFPPPFDFRFSLLVTHLLK